MFSLRVRPSGVDLELNEHIQEVLTDALVENFGIYEGDVLSHFILSILEVVTDSLVVTFRIYVSDFLP